MLWCSSQAYLNTTCRPTVAAPDEAAAGVNLPYIHANEDALSMTRTSSASLMRMQGKTSKQFMLTPGHLDFGSVKLGQVTLPAMPAAETKFVLNIVILAVLARWYFPHDATRPTMTCGHERCNNSLCCRATSYFASA